MTRIDAQPAEVLQAIARSMDVRAAEPAMQAICERYMAAIDASAGTTVLEVGCGNGATATAILRHLCPARLIGIDPSTAFIDMARRRFAMEPRASFSVAEAAMTGQPNLSADIVIAHTVYSHLLDPAAAIEEARRILRPGGRLVIFDGDFATLTLGLFDGDPLQAAVGAVLRNLVHAPYIMRRLPALAAAAGFAVEAVEPHGYLQTSQPDYLLTLLSRGAGAAARTGEIGDPLRDGFEAEARRRVADGSFYGAMLFVSITVRKRN